MANEISTVQSLKAVDAWIDVINANINGGVRTAFKSSRLKFGGSNANANVSRAGTGTSLPLQFPEPGLMTANTVIDFSQGAITTSTENTHLAIQGEGFFLLASPDMINADGSAANPASATCTTRRLFATRDGEFHTDKDGALVNANGYYLVTAPMTANPSTLVAWSTAFSGANSFLRAVYNDLDNTALATVKTKAIRLSTYKSSKLTGNIPFADGTTWAMGGSTTGSLLLITNKQPLQYSMFGSTVFDFGYVNNGGGGFGSVGVSVGTASEGFADSLTILNKSLEASNASMTQSVPELSLAQKLFSALTKVLQISQTNTDAVLNLVR